MKPLMSQVFQNMFIRKMDGIKLKVENKDYESALIDVGILQQELAGEDWSPFPDYKNVLQKLDVLNLFDFLLYAINKSKIQQNYDEAIKLFIGTLICYAHALNFIDCYYSDQEITEMSVIINSAAFFGVPIQIKQQIPNCGGQSYIETKNLVDPQQNRSQEYATVIDLVNSLDADNLQNFVQRLFDNLEEFTGADFEKLFGQEPNLFIKGAMKQVVDLSNEYKKNYRNLENQPQEELAEAPEFCDLATEQFNNRFRNPQ